MGGNINFGSRTEFLPGEGTNELDIKYQRYGGCFVTYKKGFVYVLASVLFAAIVGFLVYHYYSCNKHDLNANESIAEIEEEIKNKISSEKQIDSEKLNSKSAISNNVNPLYYRLKIHPYLNDNSDKKFTFEGHVTIVFQITGSPTKTIILNAKNFDISDADVSLTYSSTSLVEPASLIAEEDFENFGPPESGSLLIEETTVDPLDTTTVSEDLETIAPPEDFTTSAPLIADDDTTSTTTTTTTTTTTATPPLNDIVQNDASSTEENIIDENTTNKKELEATTVSPENTNKDEEKTDTKEIIKKEEKSTTEETSLKDKDKDVEPEMSSSGDVPITVTSPSPSSSSTTETIKSNDEVTAEPIPINTTESSSPKNASTTTVSSVVKLAEKNNVQTIKKKYDKEDGTYLLKTKLPLETGVNYTLVMKYKGKITDKLGGLYKTSYKKNNATIWIAHTILKPNYARTVFPCFDEPHFKSRFEISVARLTNMSVVSNMQLIDTYPEVNSPGWVWDHFDISPYMAPHSVGFAILGFENVKSQNSVPLPLIKLWGRKEVTDKATYILKIAPKIIKSYNKLFGYNYSLHKLDLVAVPNLPVASISSWGLIYLRESDVLVSEEFSSYEDKEKLLEILSKEIAKQWFGHIISLRSWIDSWLIETIASYSHYIAMNMIEPSWNLLDKTSIMDAQEILDVDSMGILPKITAISSNTEGQDEQQNLLNKKAGLIMLSINEILNETEFQKGIQNFVAKWKYKSFKAENIWPELSNITLPEGIKVKDIINKWTTQEGYPLITATPNYESNKITILQSNFFDINSTNNNAYWPLKLSYISSSSKDTKFEWVINTSPKVIENAVDKEENSWIFFNLNRASLCRVNYDLYNWNSLKLVLKSKPDKLSPANRAQLLDDAFHLARSGILNYTVALDMSLYLEEQEDHILPWSIILKNFEYLNLLFYNTLYYGNFQDYVLKLIEPQFKKLQTNIDDKSYDQVNLRKLIFKWACKFSYKPCRDWAYSQYETWEKDETYRVQSDLRSIVYCVGVQNLGKKAWEFLWKKYSQQVNNSDEINALITGMSCASETWLTLKYLQRALDEENIQYSVAIWNALSTEKTIDIAFEFLKDNWSKILKKYNSLAMKQILSKLLEQLTTQYHLEQITNFYSKNKSDLQNYVHDIFAIIKKLQLKLNWKEKYLNDFNSWIELQQFRIE